MLLAVAELLGMMLCSGHPSQAYLPPCDASTTIYIGSINSSAVRVGEVFKAALKQNAAAIIVCHNHPSGDPTPWPEDVAVTRQLVDAGKLLGVDTGHPLGVDVLDHLVIGHGRWVSLRCVTCRSVRDATHV